MHRSPRRAGLLVPLIGLLVAATIGLAGFQLLAGDQLVDAGRWIDRTQEWQIVLLATAEAIEDESLMPAEGGGFVLPWKAAGTHPFPIRPDDVAEALHGLTLAYPFSLSDHDAAARRTVESHGLLKDRLEGLERLGPLATLTGLPPVLRSAAVDAASLMRPVYRLVGSEAEESGIAIVLFAAAGLTCAVLLLMLAVYATRLRRQRDRFERHVDALHAGIRPDPD